MRQGKRSFVSAPAGSRSSDRDDIYLKPHGIAEDGREAERAVCYDIPKRSPMLRRPFAVTLVPKSPHDDTMSVPVFDLLPSAIKEREGKKQLLFALKPHCGKSPVVRVVCGDVARVLSAGYGRDVRLMPKGEIVSPHATLCRSLTDPAREQELTIPAEDIRKRRLPLVSPPEWKKSYRQALEYLLERIEVSDADARGSFFEVGNHVTGRWNLIPGGSPSWTGGFWVGMLWNACRFTGKSRYRDMAERWNARLLGREHQQDHDAGFLNHCSSAKGYDLTHERRYLDGALAGADRLRELFNPKVSLIPAWEVLGQQTIVDTMMNLQLLWWAHEQSGKEAYLDVGIRHARRTIELLVRKEGSCHQSVFYDPFSGEIKSWGTHQGYNPLSAWARGNGWALYGFTVAHQKTGVREFLETARRVGSFILANLSPDDVPWYDLRDPGIIFTNKDTSAGAIIACGLFYLADALKSGSEATAYRRRGRRIVDALIDHCLTPVSKNERTPVGVLKHGCYTRPGDTELIWGDYYLMEALLYLLSRKIER